MANYEEVSKTNFFCVTNEERYDELFAGLNDVEDFTHTVDGRTMHGFGAYTSIDWKDPETGEWNIDAFYDELAKILPEGEAVVITFVGHEKLRYIDGCVTVITNRDVVTRDLAGIAKEVCRTLHVSQ